VYACPNVQINHQLVQLNYTTPCPMRGPGDAPDLFALECAMDELAIKLNVDPLELRLRNYAEKDDFDQRPWSSKHLRECYERGASKFGWSSRNAHPAATRDKDGRLVGWGMATAISPARQQPAAARITLTEDGSVVIQSAAVESASGIYTVMAQFVSESLGIPMEQVRVELGDTAFPKAPVDTGSLLTASLVPAVMAACSNLREKLISLAIEGPAAPFTGVSREDVFLAEGHIGTTKNTLPPIALADVLSRTNNLQLVAEGDAAPGDAYQKLTFCSFGAVFVEVKVDSELGEVRVTRVVGVYDVGKIINPAIARSQLLGGITFGIGMALMEATIPDIATGRIVNANLAEYQVPVFSDIPPEFTIEFLDIPDPNMADKGARGLAENWDCGDAGRNCKRDLSCDRETDSGFTDHTRPSGVTRKAQSGKAIS
jgi:xanthine dehydrogenase YagR molybdenum-binding subunit